MTVPSIQFEAKLMGYAKSRNKDGDWTDIRLQVHPEETEELNRLKLGQRLQCVIVAIDDQEQPMAVVKPKVGGELARRAGILCGNVRFQEWVVEQTGGVFTRRGIAATAANQAVDYIYVKCGVESRIDLDHNPEAAEKFKALEAEFKTAHGMMAERR